MHIVKEITRTGQSTRPVRRMNDMQTFRPIDSVEALQERMTLMRKAQREFAKFTQEQVDHIFFEAAMAANKARIPLAKMAVEETGMGVMEDKVIKNHYASEYIYHAYRNTKTASRRLRSRSALSRRSFRPRTRPPRRFSRRCCASRRATPSSSARTRAPRSARRRPRASSTRRRSRRARRRASSAASNSRVWS